MKKLSRLLLILVFMLSLVDCSSKEEEKNNMGQAFISEALSFGIKDLEVKGELTKPKNTKEPFKLAVIVGGSGPTNRDGGIGKIEPYKDIAEGLAEAGIASFRYDKRTFSHKDNLTEEDIKSFTVKEEYTDDYSEIIKHFSNKDYIDKDNIYIIGHSQGGHILPMLEKANPFAKGYISLAANSTTLDKLMIEQYERTLKENQLSDEEKKEINKTIEELKQVEKLTVASASEKFAGIEGNYWVDFNRYNVVEEFKKINKPILILQGKNDYQVREKEFNAFKEGLNGKENVELKMYNGLTHLFTKGEKNLASYYVNAKVEQVVIDDIVNFINK